MGVYIGQPLIISDMKGPSPDGFHIPLSNERQAILDIWSAIGGGTFDPTNFSIALKLPFAGDRNGGSGATAAQGSRGYYWASSYYNGDSAYSLYFDTSYVELRGNGRSNAFSVRSFKDTPTIPTSSWVKLYGTSIEAGGIFWASDEGLISLSSDGQNWITIADKNLGATQVWNNGDALSEVNCGKYYQWGNNYGFPRSGSVTASGTQVNASAYGPGNYYSSSTFITRGSSPYRWDTTDNGNLRGGVSQGTSTKRTELKNVYIGLVIDKATFTYTGADQTYTVRETGTYRIVCKGAGSNTSAGGLGQGDITLNKGDILSVMVGQNGGSTSSGTYGFGGTSNYSSNRSGGGLSGVFIGGGNISASDSARALVIGGGAGGGRGGGVGGVGGGESGANGQDSGYGTLGGGGTQTGHGSSGNAGANQFNGGNGSRYYGYGGGGGWWGGNASIGDTSSDDDKGAGGGSGYVISTASNRVLTQGGGASANSNGTVTIEFIGAMGHKLKSIKIRPNGVEKQVRP